MWTSLLKLAGGWVPLIQWGVIAGLVASGMYLAHDYKQLGTRNVTLTRDLAQARNELKIVKESRAQDKLAIQEVDRRLQEKGTTFADLLKALQDICGAREGDAENTALEGLKKRAVQ